MGHMHPVALWKSQQGVWMCHRTYTNGLYLCHTYRWMKFRGCGHPHKTSSIEGTDRSMRSRIVMETHPSCINVEKQTWWLDV